MISAKVCRMGLLPQPLPSILRTWMKSLRHRQIVKSILSFCPNLYRHPLLLTRAGRRFQSQHDPTAHCGGGGVEIIASNFPEGNFSAKWLFCVILNSISSASSVNMVLVIVCFICIVGADQLASNAMFTNSKL